MGKKYIVIGHELVLEKGDIAKFAGDFSSFVQGLNSPLDEQLGAGDFERLKVSLKRDGDAFKVEMKLKRRMVPDVERDNADAALDMDQNQRSGEKANATDVAAETGAGSDADVRTKKKRSPGKSRQATQSQIGDAEGDRADARTRIKTTKKSYLRLKKAMQKNYDVLRDCMERGQLPDDETVLIFLQQAEQMIAYPDKGEPLYSPFNQACTLLQVAHETKQLNRFVSAMEKLDDLKKQAHDKFR